MPSKLFTTLAAVLLVPSSLLAQRPYHAEEGFLVRAAVPTDSAREHCLTDLLLGTVSPVDRLDCRVTEFVIMDTTDAWWWIMARYRRGAVERLDTEVDTVDVDELVLLALEPRDDVLLPVWHIVRDREFEFIDGFRWARKRSGLLLAVDLCLNGTGGCYEELLTEYAGDHWAVVEQTYLEELAQRAPDGFRLHKGRRLDLETLDGEQPIATSRDRNCCPSGMMRFSTWMDGRRLRLVSAEVVAP